MAGYPTLQPAGETTLSQDLAAIETEFPAWRAWVSDAGTLCAADDLVLLTAGSTLTLRRMVAEVEHDRQMAGLVA